MNIKERNELLIRLDERTLDLDERSKKQEKAMGNHLEHHFKYSIMAWTITLGAIATTIVAITRLGN